MGDMIRAVRFHEWGSLPTVDVIPRPVRRENETLVRIEAAAVSHLDRTVASGDFGLKPPLPYVGGVEGCGIVEESETIPVGSRVMVRGGGLGLVRDGTWAEFVSVGDRHITLVPDGMQAAVGATFFLPLSTAHVALHHVGRLGTWSIDGVASSADEVVVVGGAAGAVGSMVVQLARRDGATVLGVVADEHQAERLPAGVEPLVAADLDRAASLAKDRPATLLVDTLGGAGLGERSAWVRPGGRAVAIGYVAGTGLTLDLPNWLLQDVALLPVNMIRRDQEARAIASELAPALVSGELRMNVEQFTFDDAARALEMLGAGRLNGRAVLVPEGN